MSRIIGTTKPISEAAPTEAELQLSAELAAELERQDPGDTPDESRRREEVLGRLSQICKEWSRAVALRRGAPEDAGAKIFTFGSYRLGVSGRGADIDTLCVGPAHCDRREDFFGSLVEMLRRCPEVSEITPVPDAGTPVLSLVFAGIDIDLVYAHMVGTTRISDSFSISDDTVLNGLDDQSVRSLNGPRVVEDILRLVPNRESFKGALRAIKVWAKRKHIYTNKIGYLGGISWAILVARTCQLYPNACSSTVVAKFFLLMRRWKWPSPILLCALTPEKGHKVWNPRQYTEDQKHLMPIVTPTYPSMNTTYNMTKSALALISDEFEAAAAVCTEVAEGRTNWATLFFKSNFFARYKLFVMIELVAATQTEFNSWEGCVLSRLRKFVELLEHCQGVRYAQPLLDAFDYTPSLEGLSAGVIAHSYFLGLKFEPVQPPQPGQPPQQQRIDVTPAVSQFMAIVMAPSPTFTRGSSMEIRITPVTYSNLPATITGGPRPNSPVPAPAGAKRQAPNTVAQPDQKRPRPATQQSPQAAPQATSVQQKPTSTQTPPSAAVPIST